LKKDQAIGTILVKKSNIAIQNIIFFLVNNSFLVNCGVILHIEYQIIN